MMQMTNVFGHLRMIQCWQVDFDEKFPFTLSNFKLVQRLIKTQCGKQPDVIFTRQQWIEACDWHANLIDKLLDLDELKHKDPDGSWIYDSEVLGNNADKCYFVIK